MKSIRALTLNLWKRKGPWEARLPLLRRELEALAPDVVGLQEVVSYPPGAPFATTAHEVAEGLGYEVAFAAAAPLAEGGYIGNALLSRFPLDAIETRPLPRGEEAGEARVALSARLAAPFAAVPVFVTHLSYQPWLAEVREAQVRALAEAVDQLAPPGEAAFPALLMGDFNAPPESDIVRFLTGMTSLGGDRAHFVDVASWHGPPSSPSATYDATRNAFAAAGNLPTRRIDYLLLRKRDRTALGVPLRVQLAFTEPAGGVWASDHFGVWADLSAQE